jgi:hypothetical protein
MAELKLIREDDGTEVTMWGKVPDIHGRLCTVEHLVSRGDGYSVLISHAETGTQLVPAEQLRCRIEEDTDD